MTIALYVIAFSALAVSFFKSREKTLLALKKAWKSFENILPQFLSILIIIGMMLAILTPEQISKLLGSESGWYGVLIAAVIGSITLIPGFVAFPLAAALLKSGAGYMQIKCSLANWTGIAYKISRTSLDKCKDMDILKQSGVYFLFGTDKDDNAVVYIGQAGIRKNGKGLLLRVQEEHPSIDYWTETIMFTTSNNSFGPTEISYLENRFCNLAIQANRYTVKNGNDPNPGNITEETESELEEFIDYAKIVMGALGHKIFEPFISSGPESESEPLLYFEYSGSKATGKRTSDGFVVFKGSTLKPQITKACPKRAIKDRNKYAELIDEAHTLTADVLLSSPSAGASFIGGASLSGNFKWKDENGVSLGELEKMNK